MQAVAQLIGRRRELRAIEEFLAVAGHGPRAMVLLGPEGIGRTSLCEAVVSRARKAGVRVLRSNPVNAETDLPFAALGDLFQSIPNEEFDRLPPPQGRALRAALLLADAPAEGTPPLAVYRAAATIVRDLAERGPLLIVIDDAHFLDTASAEAVGFALRRIARAPVRALLSVDPDVEPPRPSPLRLDELIPEIGRRLVLEPLDANELARVVHAATGRSVPVSRRSELRRLTAGRPGDAVVLVGSTSESEFSFRSSVLDVLRSRFSALPSRTRESLALVAAATAPTERLTIQAGGSAEGLRHAADAGLLRNDEGHLRLTPPLLAEVVRTLTNAEERRQAHRALAVAAEDVDVRAHHLALGAEIADAVTALQLDEAAARSRSRGSPAAGAELAAHALRLTPVDDASARHRRAMVAADLSIEAGDAARAESLLGAVLDEECSRDVRAAALWRLGRIRYVTNSVPEAIALLEAAAAAAAPSDPHGVLAHQALAFLAPVAGDPARGLRHAQRALDGAQRLNDKGLLALASTRLAGIRFLTGDGLDRELLDRAVADEVAIADVPVEWLPRFTDGVLSMFADDLEHARVVLDGLAAELEESGRYGDRATVLFELAMLECRAGKLEVADRYANEAVEASVDLGQDQVLAHAFATRVLVDAYLGRVDEVRESAARGLELCQRVGAVAAQMQLLTALAFLELSVPDPEAALGLLEPIVGSVSAGGITEPGVVRFMPDIIEALLLTNQFERASGLLTTFEERAVSVDRASALAAAHRCRALHGAATGDFEAAQQSVELALTAHQRLPGERFERGRTLLIAGAIDRRNKQKRSARAYLAEAIAVFEAVGATSWAARARTELGRVSGRPESTAGLTSAEEQISWLAAAGRTNKEIAATLFVSVRTVEANLTRAYAKLGIRSRGGLAVALRDNHADSPDSSRWPAP